MREEDNFHNKSLMARVLNEVTVAIAVTSISDLLKVVTTMNLSVIRVAEWDDSYEVVNRLIYKMNPEQYMKHRTPTNDKSRFELTDGTRYTVRINRSNWVLIEAEKSDNKSLLFVRTLIIKFLGDKKHQYRQEFLQSVLKYKDKDRIPVSYIGNFELDYNIIPHSFDDVVLNETTKHNIITGITNWKNSKEWYREHHLVHKIGVLLYGQPGTGKSTVAKAISTMLGNALILTMSPNDIMGSIRSIIHTRKRHSGTIIVLIEDIDMFFPKDGEENNQDSTSDPTVVETGDEKPNRNNQSNLTNQNAMFQLLDGVYSTDDTIYIATTNYLENLDEALIRYGRFDIQEQLFYFTKDDAKKFVKSLGYEESILNEMNGIWYPIQPAYLQSKVMEYRANQLRKESE